MVKNFILVFSLICSVMLAGCETVHKVGNTAGAAVGEVTNAVGSVTEGGAEAVQGKTTAQENPYNR
jgi:predicted small secreted protein